MEDFNAFLTDNGEAAIDLAEVAKDCKEAEEKMNKLFQRIRELKKHPLLSEFLRSSEIQAAESIASFLMLPIGNG